MDFTPNLSYDCSQNNNITICTTGITSSELSIIQTPASITISPVLTPKTTILVTYKCLFTKKYIQALKWNIPIVSSNFLYDLTASFKKYEMRPLEGAVFSTSGINEEIFGNYLTLLGAVHEPNCSIFIDFLVCDSEESEKYKFCIKNGIPVIKSKEIFNNFYDSLVKLIKYDAKQLKPPTMFFEKIFYIDPELPKPLFNKLRRLIVENEGTRISTLNEDVNFILTIDYEKHDISKTIYYQYVFECIASNAILYPEFYRVYRNPEKVVLKDVFAVVDRSLGIEVTPITNKLKSLGATVKTSIDMRTTHYISNKRPTHDESTENRKNYSQQTEMPNSIKYFTVLPLWVNQCLHQLKHVKETKYFPNGSALSIKRLSEKTEEEMKFQFTGLPTFFKQQAITKFEKMGISFSESSAYENCTHLIMGEFSLSEKFFGALVNGRWILTPGFIEAFDNKVHFDFSKYEWKVGKETNEKHKRKIESIKKWRERIQLGGKQPFYKWTVKLYCADNKRSGIVNLITQGGGTMTDKANYTHVFVDKSYKGTVEEDKTLSTDYIFSYLFK